MSDTKKYLKACQELVESDLQSYFSAPAISGNLQESMKYSLFAGGKRIRPALAFAACEAVGAQKEKAIPVASALEMIHTYSLIHDDLPAMDDDDLRRGQPTNHKKFGEATAILAGDGLLTQAFHRLADVNWTIPAETRIDIIRRVATGSGTYGMVAGQALDLHFEGREDVNEKTLEKIHANKTGQLFWAAITGGGLAGGASDKDLEALEAYGKNIGLAFQVADDLLDVTASTEEMGKATKKDQNKKKVTYPSLLGLEESKKRAAHLLEKVITSTDRFGENGNALRFLARFVIERRS